MSIVLYIYHCDLKVELFSSNCDLIYLFFVRSSVRFLEVFIDMDIY